ncbi:helicostatins isoform X2 [Contarinia nasturtii]|uniref:helicostatins isoform X2 n=1 Tax=Contarinia nasturtii TaxID=265458 RepID=UPI0012D48E78|nr:helicostatins isoform X2 [Contarinia nasturtii]
MRSIAISIILLGYIVTISKCEQAYESNAVDFDGLATDIDKDSMIKRMERRAYTYMTGIPGTKRLPNYNFGLGKRARPYRFGLGKRSDDLDYDDSALFGDQQNWRPWFERDQRSRYNMGLGKRGNVERRTPPERLYGFGLGKRAANIEEDASTTAPIDQSNYDGYDRIRASRGALSVGLGKRLIQDENVERRSGAQRYNFGLGR